MLGVLVFTRLCTFQKMSMSKSAKDRKQGQQQMVFNQSNKGEIPVNSDNFLVFVSERMMNIVARMANKQEFNAESKPMKMEAQSLDCDEVIQGVHLESFIGIKDKVFPSINEIFYCIKRKLVNDKDLLLYKLIIDLHEAVNNKSRVAASNFAAKELVPCSIKFYKQLSEGQVERMLEQMHKINSKIKVKSSLRKVSDSDKHDFEQHGLSFEQVFELKARDPLADDCKGDDKRPESKDDFL